MTKKHYIADESIGGIMREYVEVDRVDGMWLSDEVTKDYCTLEPTDVVYKKYKIAEILSKCTPDKRHEEVLPVSAPDKVVDLLANLARRVTSLETQVKSLSTQLRDTQRNVERQAEELEAFRYTHVEHVAEEPHQQSTIEIKAGGIFIDGKPIEAIMGYYGGAR